MIMSSSSAQEQHSPWHRNELMRMMMSLGAMEIDLAKIIIVVVLSADGEY